MVDNQMSEGKEGGSDVFPTAFFLRSHDPIIKSRELKPRPAFTSRESGEFAIESSIFSSGDQREREMICLPWVHRLQRIWRACKCPDLEELMLRGCSPGGDLVLLATRLIFGVQLSLGNPAGVWR